MKEKEKEDKKVITTESQKANLAVAQNATEKKQSKKTVVVKTIKGGAGLISRSGDFIGRLGTLMVMIVTSINTATIMVTSFLEGVYWKGAVHAFFFACVNLPMIVVMVWFMCKARVQAMYRKIRPSRPGEAIAVTEVEDETIVYEETVEVATNEEDKSKTENTTTKRVSGTIAMSKKVAEKLNQEKAEEKIMKVLKVGEQINQGFSFGPM